MSVASCDIFISGGGIAGLVAALGFAHSGFSTVLADPGPLPEPSDQSDLRSTAYLQPGRALLDEIGVWPDLAVAATPLETLRVIDSAGDPPAIRTERAFRSDDLGAVAFGWNLPNALTRQVLAERATTTDGLTLKFGTGFSNLLSRDGEARITLGDGTRIAARLAIAADGRASPLREAAGIDVEITRYGQKALAFAVTHEVPHNAVSTELYLSGGAFVLVPLPDHRGQPASAVVWMNDGPEALRLHALDDDAFARAATLRSCNVLGPLSLSSPRQVWPVVTQKAKALTARRVALVAEAAHVLPPIGAQGLNTSLMDIRLLLDLARKAPDSLGTRPYLDRYAKAREADIRARARIIDLYNRLCRSDAPPAQALRSLGLRTVHDIAPLRQRVMQAGLGRARKAPSSV
ncbi:MAG: UbiH/UbiF family hydroxylase [Silicimonas sp.]|nr:UbiH/UbiF family hydroxylase [Silicimonas sp.]